MATVKITYEKDLAGTNEVMNSAEMVALMAEVAEKGKGFAISISPRDTGHYSESFEVTAHDHGGPNHDRAEAILTNTADYAWEVEWRNKGEDGQDGHHVLGRTVDFIESEYR